MMRSALFRAGCRYLTRNWNAAVFPEFSRFQLQPLSPIVGHGGGQIMRIHDLHTKGKGDQELLNFLGEEISTEKKAQKSASLPSSIDDFSIKNVESEVTLTKRLNNETITLSLSVNHTLDLEDDDEADPSRKSEQDEINDMRSKPNFEVEVKKGEQILSFRCSYVTESREDSQEEFSDAFAIDEISISSGDKDTEEYIASGDILDGYLYDLFMNFLDERGITNEFAEKLSTYCTNYEHNLYITMLGKIQNFITSK